MYRQITVVYMFCNLCIPIVLKRESRTPTVYRQITVVYMFCNLCIPIVLKRESRTPTMDKDYFELSHMPVHGGSSGLSLQS
jgi:hypothetical protein